jgi:uncharacterized protein
MADDTPQPAHAFLQKELYVINTRPVASRAELDKVLPQHLAHQVSLEKRGIMFGAGPLFGKDGKPFGGMIIIRAASFEEAERIAGEDPFHAQGLRTFTVDRWQLNEGSITLTVSYSDQKVKVG